MRHRPLIPPASATAIGLALASLSALTFAGEARAGAASHRLIVLADMGNEPDEMQQMVHMLMYANELEIEGLVAVTGKYLKEEAQAQALPQADRRVRAGARQPEEARLRLAVA